MSADNWILCIQNLKKNYPILNELGLKKWNKSKSKEKDYDLNVVAMSKLHFMFTIIC